MTERSIADQITFCEQEAHGPDETCWPLRIAMFRSIAETLKQSQVKTVRDVVREIREHDAEQGHLVAVVANRYGWNGVENSKILSVFIERELETLRQLRAEVGPRPDPAPQKFAIEGQFFICGKCRTGHDGIRHLADPRTPPDGIDADVWTAVLDGVYRACLIDEAQMVHDIAKSVQQLRRHDPAPWQPIIEAMTEPNVLDHPEPIHARIEWHCWKQHHQDFHDCEEPPCVLLKRIAQVIGWEVGLNGVTRPALPVPPERPSAERQE